MGGFIRGQRFGGQVAGAGAPYVFFGVSKKSRHRPPALLDPFSMYASTSPPLPYHYLILLSSAGRKERSKTMSNLTADGKEKQWRRLWDFLSHRVALVVIIVFHWLHWQLENISYKLKNNNNNRNMFGRRLVTRTVSRVSTVGAKRNMGGHGPQPTDMPAIRAVLNEDYKVSVLSVLSILVDFS